MSTAQRYIIIRGDSILFRCDEMSDAIKFLCDHRGAVLYGVLCDDSDSEQLAKAKTAGVAAEKTLRASRRRA